MMFMPDRPNIMQDAVGEIPAWMSALQQSFSAAPQGPQGDWQRQNAQSMFGTMMSGSGGLFDGSSGPGRAQPQQQSAYSAPPQQGGAFAMYSPQQAPQQQGGAFSAYSPQQQGGGGFSPQQPTITDGTGRQYDDLQGALRQRDAFLTAVRNNPDPSQAYNQATQMVDQGFQNFFTNPGQGNVNDLFGQFGMQAPQGLQQALDQRLGQQAPPSMYSPQPPQQPGTIPHPNYIRGENQFWPGAQPPPQQPSPADWGMPPRDFGPMPVRIPQRPDRPMPDWGFPPQHDHRAFRPIDMETHNRLPNWGLPPQHDQVQPPRLSQPSPADWGMPPRSIGPGGGQQQQPPQPAPQIPSAPSRRPPQIDMETHNRLLADMQSRYPGHSPIVDRATGQVTGWQQTREQPRPERTPVTQPSRAQPVASRPQGTPYNPAQRR